MNTLALGFVGLGALSLAGAPRTWRHSRVLALAFFAVGVQMVLRGVEAGMPVAPGALVTADHLTLLCASLLSLAFCYRFSGRRQPRGLVAIGLALAVAMVATTAGPLRSGFDQPLMAAVSWDWIAQWTLSMAALVWCLVAIIQKSANIARSNSGTAQVEAHMVRVGAALGIAYSVGILAAMVLTRRHDRVLWLVVASEIMHGAALILIALGAASAYVGEWVESTLERCRLRRAMRALRPWAAWASAVNPAGRLDLPTGVLEQRCTRVQLEIEAALRLQLGQRIDADRLATAGTTGRRGLALARELEALAGRA